MNEIRQFQICSNKHVTPLVGIDFVVLYTDEGSSVTLQMCSLTRDVPGLALFAL